jgi:hypothetical protein
MIFECEQCEVCCNLGIKINMKTILFPLLFASAMALAGCVEQPQRVSAVYIPSLVFKGASCQELLGERARLAGYVAHVTAAQRRAADNDAALVIVGAVVFWPALLALPLTVDQSAQLAVARGHYDALNEAIRKQGCQGASHASAPRHPEFEYSVGTWKRYRGDFPPL